MALDHSRLGLENKSSRIFLRSTSLHYKILLTNLGACEPTFLYFLYITSEVKQYYEALFLWYRPRTECSISQFWNTNCWLIQYSGRSKHAWALAKPLCAAVRVFINVQEYPISQQFRTKQNSRLLIRLYWSIQNNSCTKLNVPLIKVLFVCLLCNRSQLTRKRSKAVYCGKQQMYKKIKILPLYDRCFRPVSKVVLLPCRT